MQSIKPASTLYLVLAATYQEGMDAARALSLRPAIWPSELHHVTPNAGEHVTLVRVEGWERSSQTAEVVAAAERVAHQELDVPTVDVMRYGMERAELAADRLALLRDAKRHGSPFLAPEQPEPVHKTVHSWQRAQLTLAHALGMCPTRRAGLPCTVPPGTCRWSS